MDIKIIVKFLEAYSQATLIPLAAYEKGNLIYSSTVGASVAMLLSSIRNSFLEKNENFLFADGLIMTARIKGDCGVTVVLGPIAVSSSTRDACASALKLIGLYPSRLELDELTEFFNSTRPISYDRFHSSKDALAIFLNGTAESDNASILPSKACEVISGHMTENYEVDWGKYNIEYVNEMQGIIRTGQVDKMKQMFLTEQYAPYGKLALNGLRHFKNSMMVHIYIVRRAANEGGLDEELCNRLAEMYSQQCENAQSISELIEVSRTLRLDFCQRVQSVKRIATNSMAVNKAAVYIHDNRMEKLGTGIVAKAIGVSTSYLCAEFRKQTGKSIVAYINEEKMSAAKELLIYSDHSLLEISSYLSFSSQCYFQTVFKKYEGVTPNEYRKQHKRKNDAS